MDKRAPFTRENLIYLVLGILGVGYAMIDIFALPEVDNVGVALPLGSFAICLSQKEKIESLGGKTKASLAIGLSTTVLLGLVVFFYGKVN